MKYAENLYYPAYKRHLKEKIKFFSESPSAEKYLSPEDIDSLLRVLRRDLELLEPSSQSATK